MGDSESDDSDGEGGLGNVSRVVMRPPGHSGKAKKGHLCFDASFETGNLGKVNLISEFEYDLFIRPDTCNPYQRMWFNFTVDNTKLDQRVLFHIVNISKRRNLFCDGMTPLVRSTSRTKWRRMVPQQVFFYRSPYHDGRHVLTLSFCFDKEEESYQFSYSYPYSYSRCQAHLEQIEKRKLTYFQRNAITRTLQKKSVDVVTISNGNINNKIKIKRLVLILSRLHPGDSPSSFICQGLMDFLINHHSIAKKLRDNVIFKIIPMVNPDGVVLGNHRSNLLGADLFLCWKHISHYHHPAIHAIVNLFKEIQSDKQFETDFVINLQSHSSLNGVFVHGHAYEDVYRHERHTLFPKLLSQNVDGFENDNCVFNRDNNKKSSFRRYFSDMKNSVNCYSIFASFHGFQHNKTKKFVCFNENSYYRLGRNIARTFYNYYCYTGVIAKDEDINKSNTSKKSAAPKRRFHIRKKKRYRHLRSIRHKCRNRNSQLQSISRASKKMKEVYTKEVTAVEVKSKLDMKKGRVDFSNIRFPSPKIHSWTKAEKEITLVSARKIPLKVDKRTCIHDLANVVSTTTTTVTDTQQDSINIVGLKIH